MKALKIKKNYAGCYEVVNHNWDASNGRLEIYSSTAFNGSTYWKSCYVSSVFNTLAEAKAATFAALEADGLGVTELTIALEEFKKIKAA